MKLFATTIAIAIASLNQFALAQGAPAESQFRVQEAQAVTSNISGTYSGSAVSKLDGKVLGSIRLQLQEQSLVQKSADGLGTELTTVIVGQVVYSGVSNSVITFNQGNFDPQSNSFSAIAQVVDETGMAQKISINGSVKAGSFVGEISLDQDPSFGISVSLSQQNSAPSATAK